MRFEVMGAGPASEPRFLYAILAGALFLPAVIAVALHPQGDSLSRPLLFAFLFFAIVLFPNGFRLPENSKALKRAAMPAAVAGKEG